MKLVFIANGIKEVKTKFTDNQLKKIDKTSERFRVDMLAKHDLLFTQTPHAVQIKH
jgi:hypothetical protein|tara:strand:+ start:437 stop:604 length:168 start_codon:yes stop_codon:yes gene_type:complete